MGASSWNWLWVWGGEESTAAVLVGLSLLFLPLFIFRKKSFSLYPALLGVAGIGLVMLAAPSWRFGIGYMIIIPALFFSDVLKKCFEHRRAQSLVSPLEAKLNIVKLAVVGLASLVFLAVGFLVDSGFEKQIQIGIHEGRVTPISYRRILLPPPTHNVQTHYTSRKTGIYKLSDLELVPIKARGFEYSVPKVGFQCWTADLPCACTIVSEVSLRSLGKGIEGGFKRTK
jgi:hypothetical protein